jgi:HSP90 family molecular chaperone
MDNGCGMDKAGIQDFATYSLDQETREQRAGEMDKSFISKFGVGVKQAGFFLGDQINLTTKTSNSSVVLCLPNQIIFLLPFCCIVR